MKISNTFITTLVNNHVKTLSRNEYVELRRIIGDVETIDIRTYA